MILCNCGRSGGWKSKTFDDLAGNGTDLFERCQAVWEQPSDEDTLAVALLGVPAPGLGMVRAGVPLAVVQNWAGHQGIKMTLRYWQLRPTNLEDARDVLERSMPMILPVSREDRPENGGRAGGQPVAPVAN